MFIFEEILLLLDIICEFKEGEEDGKNYFFVFVVDMFVDIEVNKYFEYGIY